MPNSYDYDLRRKVMDAIELDGMPKAEASRVFNVSRNTIHLWCQLKAETGDVYPKPLKHQGPKYLISDWAKFKRFLEANADKTQRELAELWEDDISARSISRALKRIGFTRKKNLWLSRTRRSKTDNFSSITLEVKR